MWMLMISPDVNSKPALIFKMMNENKIMKILACYIIIVKWAK